MFRNYFKTAVRSFIRNRKYTLVNIAGMAIGIAVSLMIFIVIRFHTSVDDFHIKKDHIYRVLTAYHDARNGSVTYGKDVPLPLPEGLKAAFPVLENVTKVWASHDDQLLILDHNGTPVKTFKEKHGIFFTDPAFFEIFDFPFLAGSPASLGDPNNVVLTKEIAEKYFGSWQNAIGKTMNIEVGGHIFEHGSDKLKVSGILAPIPANSDFKLKIVVSFGTGITGFLAQNDNWNDRTTSDYACYVLLPPGMSPDNFNRQLRAYSARMKLADIKDHHILQPLNEVHYDIQAGNFSNKAISKRMINVLWLIGTFILLIACINFINVSTAQAINRAREVGVRKVLGSSRSQLQLQFMLETLMIVCSAMILAAIVSLFAMPYLNQMLELSLPFNIFNDPVVLLFLTCVALTVTALAGFYPSLILSRYNPVEALKSKANFKSGISLRRALVIFQFTIAQVLIMATLIMLQQMNLFFNQPLGFDKDAIINVPFRVDSLRISRFDYLKGQLLSINGVQDVSFSSNTPVEDRNDLWSSLRFNHAASEAEFKAITKFADPGYLQTYGLTLIAGRNLLPSEMTREFLVNEALLDKLGIDNPDDMLNKEISIWNDNIKCKVVGVLKNFNNRPLQYEVAPLLITTNSTMYNQAALKVSLTNTQAILRSVSDVFKKTFPNFVYEYSFFDHKIEAFYKQESQLSALYIIFSAIAIALSCLGLYGLASFMAIQRIKEVGIRKLLGASSWGIVFLFSKEFIVLVCLAFAIATPFAWYFMHQWLQDYLYRISISWLVFAVGGIAALAIALVTISYHAVKAARVNPAKNLRTD